MAESSRPHGAFHSKLDRITTAAPSFTTARASLVDILENLSFLSVVSVQDSKAGYVGEAVEVHFRTTSVRETPKMVFFDKFGRSRSQLAVGPIQLAQAPLGLDHRSSVPTVGEILVGSVVPNTRPGNLRFVLRGWSSDAKPLKELLRLLKFGTKLSEFESRSLLLQSSCLLVQCPAAMKKSRDDIYMTARIILWGSIRPLQVLASVQEPKKYALKVAATQQELDAASLLKLSTTASDFIDLLVVKLHDADLSEAFTSGLNITEPEIVVPTFVGHYGSIGQPYAALESSNGQKPIVVPGNGRMYPEAYNPEAFKADGFRPVTPEYPRSRSSSPPYRPSSPAESGTPRYAPHSPIEEDAIAAPSFMPARSGTPTQELYSEL